MNLQNQIRQKLVGGIINGAFPPGMKLPSSRKLSQQLNVARNTVVAAYQQLVADGYLISRQRSGVFVNEKMLEARVAHWQKVMPGVMHVVKYEDFATDPKPVIEELLGHCDLSYEEACLNYYKNKNASTTGSAVQVRGQLFQSSIDKWRNYEKQLAPVVKILGKPS